MDVETKGAARAQIRGNQGTRKYMPNLTAGREGFADPVVIDPIEHATQSSSDTDYKKLDKYTLRDQKVREAWKRYRIRKSLLALPIGSLESRRLLAEHHTSPTDVVSYHVLYLHLSCFSFSNN